MYADSIPDLGPGVTLAYDMPAGAWYLERAETRLVLDRSASALVRRIDGSRSISDIAASLAEWAETTVSLAEADCLTLFGDLAKRNFLVTLDADADEDPA